MSKTPDTLAAIRGPERSQYGSAVVTLAGTVGGVPVPAVTVSCWGRRAGVQLDRETPAIVHRVPIHGRGTLAATGAGWDLLRDQHGRIEWGSVTVQRPGEYISDDASPAARQWMTTALLPAVAAWLGSDAATLTVALGAVEDARAAQARARKAQHEAADALTAARAVTEAADAAVAAAEAALEALA